MQVRESSYQNQSLAMHGAHIIKGRIPCRGSPSVGNFGASQHLCMSRPIVDRVVGALPPEQNTRKHYIQHHVLSALSGSVAAGAS